MAPGRACCLVDVDGMIWVNDSHGHAEGDRVLATVARSLAALAADQAIDIFRVGGDEFLIVLPLLERSELRHFARRLVDGLRALGIPYSRTDRPSRTVLEVNAVILRVDNAFAARAFGEFGLTGEARDWIAQRVFREKQRLGREAGIVVDLFDAAVESPWAG